MSDIIETVDVNCPYCGEVFSTTVDCSAGEEDYIEDCQVCCQPIEFKIRFDINGTLQAVQTQRSDD
jgi:transcription elongation factor Elf1